MARPGNRLLRKVFDLENALSPNEYVNVLKCARWLGAKHIAQTLESSATARDLAAQDRIHRFRGKTMSRDARMFLGRMRWKDRLTLGSHCPGRGLLVVFTGTKNRPMIPLPVFLQRIDDLAWDVLVLRDSRKDHYRQGCHGFAADFGGLAARISRLGAGYETVVALGTSMGGFAAARAQVLGAADHAISIGGRPAWDVRRIMNRKRRPMAYDPICACLEPRQRSVCFAYSEGNEEDRHAAIMAAHLCGGTCVPIAGTQGHNALAHLWRQGQLGATLSGLLQTDAATSKTPQPAVSFG